VIGEVLMKWVAAGNAVGDTTKKGSETIGGTGQTKQ
jgi:hypothetical protein